MHYAKFSIVKDDKGKNYALINKLSCCTVCLGLFFYFFLLCWKFFGILADTVPTCFIDKSHLPMDNTFLCIKYYNCITQLYATYV